MVVKLLCVICEAPIELDPVSNWSKGHNALPVRNGRCCSECNDRVVLPMRLQRLRAQGKKEPPPPRPEPSQPFRKG